LRCFVAVAEELHFSRAAARLFMTQPPLSRQIQMLERSMGTVLLERSNRGVKLTTAGQGFLRDARHILALAEQASDAARRLASGEVGRLTLGFTAVSAYRLIPDLLATAALKMPKVEFVLREMVSSTQLEALSTNLIDIAFCRHVTDRQSLDVERVSSEPLLAVMPGDHPLAAKSAINVGDLDQQPFVMYAADEGRFFYECIAGLFAMTGVTPRYVYHLGQTHTIVSMVKAGLGLAIVPASAQQLHTGNLAFRPLIDGDLRADIFMVSRRDNANPALRVFRELVRSTHSL
jgi:DNA-binding transcriptional LysR family regulator